MGNKGLITRASAVTTKAAAPSKAIEIGAATLAGLATAVAEVFKLESDCISPEFLVRVRFSSPDYTILPPF
jgi:hypothetical protein